MSDLSEQIKDEAQNLIYYLRQIIPDIFPDEQENLKKIMDRIERLIQEDGKR